MPAARYWRIVGIETYAGGDLELSELHLYGTSGRLDAAATLTSTIAPTAGTLAALQDDNLGTTCRFAAAAVRAGGFALVWDFGAGNTADAIGVRLGAAAQEVFMAGCSLQYSADGAQWTWLVDFARYAWPGAGAYTAAPAVGDPDYAKVALLLHMDGANGSTTFTDSSATPNTVTAVGGVAISTAQSKFGGASANFSGTGVLLVPHSSDISLNTGDITIEMWLRLPSIGDGFILLNKQDGSSGAAPLQILTTAAGAVRARSYDASFATFFNAQTPGGVLTAGDWDHIALVRAGSIFTIYVRGVARASATYTGALLANAFAWSVGAYSNLTGDPLVGQIDDLRISGDARYTENFDPPTGPFQEAGGTGGTVIVAPTLHTAASAAQIAASAPVPAHSTPLTPRLQLARDVEHGGPGTIYGTTKTKGTPNVPTKARVVLLHQRSKLPVRETWSDPVTGAFTFTGIDPNQQFLTLAEDAAGNFRPVAASRLTPEVAA